MIGPRLTGPVRRVVRLFVDSAWLAGGALGCVTGSAMAAQAGLAGGVVAVALLAGLGAVLAASVVTAARGR